MTGQSQSKELSFGVSRCVDEEANVEGSLMACGVERKVDGSEGRLYLETSGSGKLSDDESNVSTGRRWSRLLSVCAFNRFSSKTPRQEFGRSK